MKLRVAPKRVATGALAVSEQYTVISHFIRYISSAFDKGQKPPLPGYRRLLLTLTTGSVNRMENKSPILN